jgi:hypothetical protein
MHFFLIHASTAAQEPENKAQMMLLTFLLHVEEHGPEWLYWSALGTVAVLLHASSKPQGSSFKAQWRYSSHALLHESSAAREYSQERCLLHAELESDMPGVLHRCVKLISGIKKSVADMRVEAEAATCYREKCSIILSTAIGASVALDEVVYC